MPYIGRQPQVGRYTQIDDNSSQFNGTLTTFVLKNGGDPQNVFVPNGLIVSLGGVIQKPTVDFTVSGSSITFTTAPTAGTTFFAYLLGDTLNVGMASDNAVLTRSIADGAVTGPKLNDVLQVASSNVVFSGANIVFANTTHVNFTGANVVGLSASQTGGGGGGGSISGVTVISETANGDLDFTFHNANTNINMTDPYVQAFFSARSNTTISSTGFLTVTF